MTGLRRPQRVIIRHFYALLGIVTLATGLGIGLVLVAFQADTDHHEELDEYHLRSLTIVSEMSARVSEIRGDLLGAGVTRAPLAMAQQRELANVAFALEDKAASLLSIQEGHPHTEFQGTLDRVLDQSQSLRSDSETEGLTAAEADTWLEALQLSVFQLSRLHSIEIEDDLQEVSEERQQILFALLVAGPLLVGVVIFLVWRLLRLLRKRLHEHEAAQDSLLAAQQRLEQSQRLDALATLVGGVAHDFNNVMMVVNLHAEAAQAQMSEDDPSYRALNEVRAAGERAAHLTRQLLAFSRQELGAPEVTDLNTVIRNALPVLRSLIRDDIRLDVRCSDTIGPVLVDPAQMSQVLMTLVVNARDAIEGPGRVVIRSADVAVRGPDGPVPPGSYARIVVEDTGAGMSPEVQARALEPFFTTKEVGQGTGLGLSTVHGIVTNCGGYLRLESQPGVGTVIEIYLPHTDQLAPEPSVAGVGAPSSSSETILLVEDEDQIRDPLAHALRAHGYAVIEARDIDDAGQVAAEATSDLHMVMTDIVMPGGRGTALVERLRRSHPHLAAIYMSGYVDADILDEVLASDDAFVPKPFSMPDVLPLVREELDRRAQLVEG